MQASTARIALRAKGSRFMVTGIAVAASACALAAGASAGAGNPSPSGANPVVVPADVIDAEKASEHKLFTTCAQAAKINVGRIAQGTALYVMHPELQSEGVSTIGSIKVVCADNFAPDRGFIDYTPTGVYFQTDASKSDLTKGRFVMPVEVPGSDHGKHVDTDGASKPTPTKTPAKSGHSTTPVVLGPKIVTDHV